MSKIRVIFRRASKLVTTALSITRNNLAVVSAKNTTPPRKGILGMTEKKAITGATTLALMRMVTASETHPTFKTYSIKTATANADSRFTS